MIHNSRTSRWLRPLLLLLVLSATACIATIPQNASLAATTTPTDWWKPALKTSWQLQLSVVALDPSIHVDMVDIDLFDQSAQTVAALHAQGTKVVCYMSAGSYEDWRPDASQFPAAVLGKDYEGWPGEKWLDIRQIELLAPIMRARLDLCKSKGFDAVDPDNVNSYTNDTGFPLTYQDQVAFNRWLADEAHARGLSIGLKNDSEQIDDLVEHFDWALTEECFVQGWCEEMLPFIEAGKPVFAVEYTDTDIALEDFCPQAQELRINAILKDRELTQWREACPEQSQALLFVPVLLKQSR